MIFLIHQLHGDGDVQSEEIIQLVPVEGLERLQVALLVQAVLVIAVLEDLHVLVIAQALIVALCIQEIVTLEILGVWLFVQLLELMLVTQEVEREMEVLWVVFRKLQSYILRTMSQMTEKKT